MLEKWDKKCLFSNVLVGDCFASIVGVHARCYKEEKLASAFSFFVSQFLHLSRRINNKNCDFPFCKRGVSDILEGVTSKIVVKATPRPPFINRLPTEKDYFGIYFFPIDTYVWHANVFRLSSRLLHLRPPTNPVQLSPGLPWTNCLNVPHFP